MIFFCFFVLSGFCFTNIHDSQDSRWRGSLSPYIRSTTSTRFTDTKTLSGLLLQTAHLCAWLAAGIEHGTFGTRSLEFTLFTLALLAAVVRKILKTRVTLGNISRTLLNKTKRLIFVMFKDSSSLSMFTQLTFIFSLNSITVASHLNLCSLALSWYVCSIRKSLFTECLRIALAFLILTIAPFCVRISTR